MNMEERLKEAISSGEVIKVIYEGGSQPGAVREIAPISIGNGKVRARCYTSNAVKSFVIDKIKLVENNKNDESADWSPDFKQTPRYESLRDFMEKESDTLSDLGWHLEYSENSFSLHRRFKNGKPMKGYDVSLNYEEFTFDLVAGSDGEINEENRRKSQRPWAVRAKNKDTRTFGKMENAMELFIDWAKSLSQSNSTS